MPKSVHTVVSRGREYFYYQDGRGTERAGPRVRLPNDPHTPEFWQAIRQAQGMLGAVAIDTFGAVADAYETSPAFLKLTEGTQDQYRRALRIGRAAWGSLAIKGLRPVHVQAVMDGLAGVTLHGLRCTAVIRLRRAGLSTGQIGDIVGMSLAMIERYCRFADRKTGGQAALLTLKRTSAEQDCKTVQNGKPKA